MPKRSRHNLSHYRLLTTSMGILTPAAVVEVLPGDMFVHQSTVLARVAALVAPLMHPVQVRVHHWFVPTRLVWDEFEQFITGRDPEIVHPFMTVPTENYTGLLDHMGIPDVDDQQINILPIRAYKLIRNEFYRDQQVESAAPISRASGEDTTTSISLSRVSWEKDYFTTARPNAQFGEDSVSIPFAPGTTAPVVSTGVVPHVASAASPGAGVDIQKASGGGTHRLQDEAGALSDGDIIFGDPTGLEVDLSEVEAGGIDINELRTAFARQRFLEARNRFGDRYTDLLRFLGVRSRDSRLQRPEFLGGGSSIISFSEVLATAEGTNTNVGDMAGHGITAMKTRRYRRFFEEHGYVLTLVSVRPKVMYSQQLHRMWLRATKDDYWQKENEAEGPQPVFTRELYAAAADPSTVFGWTGRHDEYRRMHSYVSGDFRYGEQSDDWHLARGFDTEPALNSSFLSCTPRDDVFASSNDPQLYLMVNHRIKAKRLVSRTPRY